MKERQHNQQMMQHQHSRMYHNQSQNSPVQRDHNRQLNNSPPQQLEQSFVIKPQDEDNVRSIDAQDHPFKKRRDSDSEIFARDSSKDERKSKDQMIFNTFRAKDTRLIKHDRKIEFVQNIITNKELEMKQLEEENRLGNLEPYYLLMKSMFNDAETQMFVNKLPKHQADKFAENIKSYQTYKRTLEKQQVYKQQPKKNLKQYMDWNQLLKEATKEDSQFMYDDIEGLRRQPQFENVAYMNISQHRSRDKKQYIQVEAKLLFDLLEKHQELREYQYKQLKKKIKANEENKK